MPVGECYLFSNGEWPPGVVGPECRSAGVPDIAPVSYRGVLTGTGGQVSPVMVGRPATPPEEAVKCLSNRVAATATTVRTTARQAQPAIVCI